MKEIVKCEICQRIYRFGKWLNKWELILEEERTLEEQELIGNIKYTLVKCITCKQELNSS